jgi:hypothetical protein
VKTLAIIGTGIAGLGCAHFLHERFDLTLYEQNDYAGGHTNTVVVEEAGRAVPIDTGFMVFNHVTYPNLTRLFRGLGVATEPAPMSFSVQHAPSGLEYNGGSLNLLFGQRRNLVNPRHWRMLAQIHRFNSEAVEALDDARFATMSLREYVTARGYGADMLERYLVPMSSAVWSTPPDKMLEFPAMTLLRFWHNHGFLGLHTQHPWFTVCGGALNFSTYERAIPRPGATRQQSGARDARSWRHADREQRRQRADFRQGDPRLSRGSGARAARRSDAHGDTAAARVFVSTQYRDAAHRRLVHAAHAPLLGVVELSHRHRARWPHAAGDALLDEQPAGRLGPRELFRLAELPRAHRAGKSPAPHRIRASRLHARRHRRTA